MHRDRYIAAHQLQQDADASIRTKLFERADKTCEWSGQDTDWLPLDEIRIQSRQIGLICSLD